MSRNSDASIDDTLMLAGTETAVLFLDDEDDTVDVLVVNDDDDDDEVDVVAVVAVDVKVVVDF
jgi:hypothetical protein